MIFRRREMPTLKERLRVWLWPRRSWERSLRYVSLRMVRMRAAPHKVALGCAIGVFASVTPFLGVQMLIAVVLAMTLRANVAAALLGTFFGNPLTWPVIWATTYTLGCALLGIPGGLDALLLLENVQNFTNALLRFSPELIYAAANILWPFVHPMFIGSLPIGLLSAAAFYYVSRRAAASYALNRAQRMKLRLQMAY